MNKVINLKTNKVHGMIDELVKHKDNIDQIIIAFTDKEGVFTSATACHTYLEAVGMVGLMRENLTYQAWNDEFEPMD